jgi:tetratricopeptide (TPR) repeat protein
MKKKLLCHLGLIFFVSISAVIISSTVMAEERCETWIAKIVSAQGSVQARVKGETLWKKVRLNDLFCPGDMVRVRRHSRSAILLSNDTIIRLDQNSTITFSGIEKKKTSFIDILTGVVHFISRFPRTLKVVTPFVNGTVEGTEFLVKVIEDRTSITVFEGRVMAANQAGSIIIKSGQSAVAMSAQAPVLRTVVRPRDAVQWTLYYPPILTFRQGNIGSGSLTGWQMALKKSIELFKAGDIEGAFSSLEEVREEVNNADYLLYRASLMLSVGRIDEASVDIESALELEPRNSSAVSLRAIIALTQNDKDGALSLSRSAVELDPVSVPARIALSYALQSNFDLDGSLAALMKAVELEPKNSLAWARLAELWQSTGDLDKSIEAAENAVELNQNLARTQTVMGFAYLSQIRIQESLAAFKRAVELDNADPLPRIGLGLAKIRAGELREGRREIEIATSLDTNRSLIRSYLGKAYYEENRDKLAKGQYDMAKDLDPLDPTPFFYDAIQKQTMNRPVEALRDLQKSIYLNDNRAVYRSRLLLDDDLAARSASLARIYNDLEFQQLALVEGWKAFNVDPSNYFAHRFLADSYSALPRHEIARVSELLQSQLLQPINITPLQPRLGESSLSVISGSGPGNLSFNEFNPLFNRDRMSLQLSGTVGGNETLGDEIVVSGIKGKVSFSVGQFHYETDGFRENNDLKQDIYNVFLQAAPTAKTSIQAEYRYREINNGDLSLNFDPDNFFDTLRNVERSRSIRLGFRHRYAPGSNLIASLIYNDSDEVDGVAPVFELRKEEDGYLGEMQHQLHTERFHLLSGVSHFNSDIKDVFSTFIMMPPAPPISVTTIDDAEVSHTNAYAYSLIKYPDRVTWTLGVSADLFDGHFNDRDQINPKIGLIWNPYHGTTLRAAFFRVLKRQLISNQTIEPTSVAGFNQFFDDDNGTDSWRYGIAFDQKIGGSIYVGAEYSRRQLDVPFRKTTIPPPPAPPIPVTTDEEDEWEEDLIRSYIYWTPLTWLALKAEYQYEDFAKKEYMPENIENLTTHRLPLGISIFCPFGVVAKVKTTYVNQKGDFLNPFLLTTSSDRDSFWVTDASIGYRLPKRRGIITLEARNLFNNNFKFQDTDPKNPAIYPERMILGRFTIAF